MWVSGVENIKINFWVVSLSFITLIFIISQTGRFLSTSLSAALNRVLALHHLTSVLAGVFLCMAGHGIHISVFTQSVIFPSHFILLSVWFSLFSPICCPLDYKMKMHIGNIEFRQTLSVWFSHSFNISLSVSICQIWMLAISLLLWGHPQRQKLIPVSGNDVEGGVLCVFERKKHTNRCVYRHWRPCCNVVLLSE